MIDSKLNGWNKKNRLIGLTDPWGTKSKDQTLFDYMVIDDNFYFYFIITDSTLTMSTFTEELSVAEGDRVELFFSPTKKLTKYYCAEIDPKGNILDYSAKYYRKFDENWDFKSLKVKTSVTEIGYLVEGKISIDELKSLGLTKDIYLGVFRADFQNRNKVNWYTKTIPNSKSPDFHISSAFEKVSFIK